MILLIASRKDVASLNIKEQILKHYPFAKIANEFQGDSLFVADFEGKKLTLATLSEESVKAQDLPEKFPNSKLVVFISSIAAKAANQPCLFIRLKLWRRRMAVIQTLSVSLPLQ
jgi:D-tyrosyl-tRNA(Tyr) deacylase